MKNKIKKRRSTGIIFVKIDRERKNEDNTSGTYVCFCMYVRKKNEEIHKKEAERRLMLASLDSRSNMKSRQMKSVARSAISVLNFLAIRKRNIPESRNKK
jgi:hypothetical protein